MIVVVNLAYFIVLYLLLEVCGFYEYIKRNNKESARLIFERVIVLLLLICSIIPTFKLAREEFKNYRTSS